VEGGIGAGRTKMMDSVGGSANKEANEGLKGRIRIPGGWVKGYKESGPGSSRFHGRARGDRENGWLLEKEVDR